MAKLSRQEIDIRLMLLPAGRGYDPMDHTMINVRDRNSDDIVLYDPDTMEPLGEFWYLNDTGELAERREQVRTGRIGCREAP